MPIAIISRDIYGPGSVDLYSSHRAEVFEEIREKAYQLAYRNTLSRETAEFEKIAIRRRRIKQVRRFAWHKLWFESGRRPGKTEITAMSAEKRLIFPIGTYDFGIDIYGNLYNKVYRRNMGYTRDVRYWTPIETAQDYNGMTEVLEFYVLRRLDNLLMGHR